MLEGPEPADFSAQGLPGDTVHAQIPGRGTSGASTPVPYEPVGVLEGPEPADFSAQGLPGDTVHAQIPGRGTSHDPWHPTCLGCRNPSLFHSPLPTPGLSF